MSTGNTLAYLNNDFDAQNEYIERLILLMLTFR
jgi:hypothetical protein